MGGGSEKNPQFVMILIVTTRGGWGGQKPNLQHVMKYAHFFLKSSLMNFKENDLIFME